MQVRVYRSALSLLTDATTRDTVAGMMAAKAYQAGVIRELLYAQRTTVTPWSIDSGFLVQYFATLTNKLATGATFDGTVTDDSAFILPTKGPGALKPESLKSPCAS